MAKKIIKGVTEPRLFTPPKRKLTAKTSLGFMAIDYSKNVLKQNLYPWQEWTLVHALEIEGDLEKKWNFRYRTIVIMVARQNGKTVLSKVLASFFLNVLQVQNVFGTSLSVEKAEEVWEAVIADQEGTPELASEIDRVARQNGGKKLVLKGGRTYKAGAPNRRAGRGDSNDLVLLDELREHRDWEAWSASVNSTNAKPNGLIVCFSNAGDPDSLVLRQLRSQAVSQISGTEAENFGGTEAEGLGWFEWSAIEDADLNDLNALAQANPALGYGLLTERALLSNLSTMPENKFRSECLCQQVDSILPEPFPKGTWNALLDPNSQIAETSELFYGIDLSIDRKTISIAVCGLREDGNMHIEVIARRAGLEWAVDWFRERAVKSRMNLSFQSRGAPVCGIAEQICTLTGVNRIPIEGPDLTNGWGRFYDSIAIAEEPSRTGVRTYHLNQPILNTCAKTCQLKNLGGGMMLPDRAKSPDDIAPLMACAMAFTAATMVKTSEKKVYQSVYADEDYGLAFV